MAPLEIRHRSVRPISAKHAQASRFLQQSPRDNDLRGADVITDPKGDRKRRANEKDDTDLYVRIVEHREDGIVVRGAKLHTRSDERSAGQECVSQCRYRWLRQ